MICQKHKEQRKPKWWWWRGSGSSSRREYVREYCFVAWKEVWNRKTGLIQHFFFPCCVSRPMIRSKTILIPLIDILLMPTSCICICTLNKCWTQIAILMQKRKSNGKKKSIKCIVVVVVAVQWDRSAVVRVQCQASARCEMVSNISWRSLKV